MIDCISQLDRERASTEAHLETIGKRLADVRSALDDGPIQVIGSRGQPRPNALLVHEGRLLREEERLYERLRALARLQREEEWRLEQAQLVEQANKLTRWR
jgi:hypothetical protein